MAGGFNLDPRSWMKANNPDDPSGHTWLSQAPFPLPGDSAYPRLKPPSEQIKNDLGNIFNIKTSIGDKLGSIWDLVPQTLGLPQEGATRLLTGNQYALPSEVPSVREAFNPGGALRPEVAGMLANIMLDPLHAITAVPIAREIYKGRLMSGQLLDEIRNFDEYRTLNKSHGKYLFKDLVDMEKLEERAGRLRFNEETGKYDIDPDSGAARLFAKKINTGNFYTWDFDSMHNPDAFKAKIDAAMTTKRYRSLIDREAGTVESLSTKGIKGKPYINPVGKILQTPDQISGSIDYGVTIMNDAHEAEARMINRMNLELHSILDGPEWIKPDSDVARALRYKIQGAPEDIWTKDPQAKRALAEYGEEAINEKANATIKFLWKALHAVPDMEIGSALKNAELGPANTVAKYLAKLGEEGHVGGLPLPHDLAETLGGKNFGSANEAGIINPNNASLKDFLQFSLHKIAKDVYQGPAKKAIRNMIGERSEDGSIIKAGTVKNMSADEYNYLHQMLDNFEGKPSSVDKTVNRMIGENKDWVRQLVLGKDLAAEAEAGMSLAEVPGIRGILGRSLENLIGKAQKNVPLVDKASTSARNTIYGGLLGLNIGSSIKNLTQLINPIVELGTKVFQGMGAVMNPEMREYLNGAGILDRTSSALSEVYKNAKWGKDRSFYDFIMSPFQASEMFTRGATFVSFLDDLKGKMPLGDALREAESMTKKYMFGYSATDVSPYIKNPIIRPFFQFATFPMKQAELLLDMAKTGSGTQNRFVRYMTLMGGAVAYGEHIGVNVNDAFLAGLIPQSIGGAPLVDTVTSAVNLSKDWFRNTFTSEPDPVGYTPSTFWRGLGAFLKTTIPAGAYGSKVLKNLVESQGVEDSFVNKMFGTDFNIRRDMAQHPWIRPFVDVLNVRPDPGIDGFDRVVRLMGFKTVHEDNRQDMMNFMKQFIKDYRYAISDLNQTAAYNGDVDAKRESLINGMRKKYGNWFSRFGVPDYEVYDSIQPADWKKLETIRKNQAESNAIQITQGFPKKIKGALQPRIREGGF